MTDGIHHKTCHEKFVDLRSLFLLKISKMKWDIKGEGERNIEGQIGWLFGILIFKNESK